METAGRELVRLSNISKTFPGVKALDGVQFTVRAGEICGLVGENGAGKSTLIKVLTGAHQADHGGEIFIDGVKTEIANPAAAQMKGIGVVYQDVMMAPHLSVGENFFLGKLPKRMGLVDWPRVYRETRETLKKVGVDVDPSVEVKKLSVAMQEMVAIAKIVRDNARVIVFDEPTALLTTEEVGADAILNSPMSMEPFKWHWETTASSPMERPVLIFLFSPTFASETLPSPYVSDK
jgi:ribose transport system ATP-binding protein